MKRTAFNGGELSPAMALRADMDVYHRGCRSLVNFSVGATGGLKRRRGFRHVMEAEGKSVLFPFTYSQDLCFLLELGEEVLRVVEPGVHKVVAEFHSDGVWRYAAPEEVRVWQVNSLLLVAEANVPLMALRLHEDSTWSFERFMYKTPPWETWDLQDSEVELNPVGGTKKLYTLKLPSGEQAPLPGEMLRVSYYTERKEAFETAASLLSGTWHVFGADRTEAQGDVITPWSSFACGDKLAVEADGMLEYYSCVRTSDSWTGSRDFVEGLTSPSNYGEDFVEACDVTAFEGVTPIYGLSRSSVYTRGAKLVVYSGYWRFWTCIKSFDMEDYVSGHGSPADYPLHFVAGIPVGDALPCGGEWRFSCSGNWVGSYEVRRSSKEELNAEWETLGESFSPIGTLSNNQLTGNEEEECYLRLFITSSRFAGADVSTGFPADSCSNKLVVESFKHDMMLRVQEDAMLRDESEIMLPSRNLKTDDWSWAAFNARFGYPSQVAVHEMRLVLAGTKHQPQTLWFSQTDDINNFADAAGDTAGLLLTMQTETQSPICWLSSRGDSLMVGTMDAEWTISAGDANTFSKTTVRSRNYGHRGAARIPALRAEDRVLFCERGAGRVLEYGFSDEVQGYVSTDTTIFADHIAVNGGGVHSGTLLRKPMFVAVFVLHNGTLACMTYNTMHNVNAWHRFETAGRFLSVCALPNGRREDRLYAIIERDGVRAIELMDEDSEFVDSGGRDYVSEVVTTAFVSPDAEVHRGHAAVLRVYFGTETPARVLEVQAGDGEWMKVSYTGNMRVGWVKLAGNGHWTDEPSLGVRCHGAWPCELLAAQM